MELEESTCLTSDCTTKPQSSRQYGTGTKREIKSIDFWRQWPHQETLIHPKQSGIIKRCYLNNWKISRSISDHFTVGSWLFRLGNFPWQGMLTSSTITGLPRGALVVKNPPAKARDAREAVQSLHWEDPLEDVMATHSSILAWRIPWAEQLSGLQYKGLQTERCSW